MDRCLAMALGVACDETDRSVLFREVPPQEHIRQLVSRRQREAKRW